MGEARYDLCMRPWQSLRVLALVLLSFAVLGCHNRRAQANREAKYKSALQTYSEKFPTGITRKVVDEYFRTRGTPVNEGSSGGSLDALSDYLRIGEEPAPWFCDKWSVYIAFDFAATEKHSEWEARDTDVLKRVRLEGRGENCL